MSEALIGVIGGSGLYEIDGFTDVTDVCVETPMGSPSDVYAVGMLEGKRVAFLPRHGRGHRFIPSEINYRANIYGFKKLGVRWLISISAVGSMRDDIEPGDMVIVDQFFDSTKRRASTFFGDGVVGHAQFADPVCSDLSDLLYCAAVAEGARVHRGGTYLCIEGPQFSTRAESRIYRSWGVDVIGMTNIPEAKLAREAGLCYATVAMATDYDCWHETHDDVSVDGVLKVLKKNVSMVRKIIKRTVTSIAIDSVCPYADAGTSALMTPIEQVPPELRFIIER